MDMVISLFMKQIQFLMHYCMDYMELFTHALIHILHILALVFFSAHHIRLYLQLMVIALTLCKLTHKFITHC